MAGILILIGILRAYFGDILKTVGVFIDGFIFGLLVVFYIIYLSDSTVNEGRFPLRLKLLTGSLILCPPHFPDKAQQFLIVGAFLIAILITILFICFDVLYNSFTLLSNIIAGYLLGAFIVYYIDDYFYEFKSYGWMYETVFIGSILAVMIILAPCQSLGPIMLSATCGTFYIVQGLCYMHGNHMNYVILNALRYTSIEDFRKVHSTPATNIEGNLGKHFDRVRQQNISKIFRLLVPIPLAGTVHFGRFIPTGTSQASFTSECYSARKTSTHFAYDTWIG